MKKTITMYLMIACGLGVASPASAKQYDKTPKPVQSTALFDNFVYTGSDSYYKEHPLKSKDAYFNPILPGWNSDPSICAVGDDYFMVTSSFSYYPGVPIFHSKDLLNWKQIGFVLNRPSQLPLLNQHVSGGIFAPAISYNPHNKTYYMITTNVGWGNFFVKTKDPFGEWSEPIRLPDVQGIDPSFFFDEDGKAYIVNNDAPEGTPEYDGHRAIRIQEFDVATDKTVGPRKVLVDKGIRPEEKPIWIEGPHIYKIKGKYYLMSAEGGTGDWHSEVILRGNSPWGPFVPAKQNPILTQRRLDKKRPNPITCAGHADLVQTPSGDWWAVFLACRPYEGKFENLGRETFLMPVKWNEEGFPYITKGDNEVIPMQGEVKGAVRGKNPTFGNFTVKDDFSSAKLGLDWFTLRAPATDLYSLTDNPGYLSLKCAPVSTSEKLVPAYIGRRIQHHEFESTTCVTFNPSSESESAGMLLFKNETHQYYLCIGKNAEGKSVEVRKIGEKGVETLAANALEPEKNTLYLKVVSRGLYFDFYYALSPGKWRLLKKDVDAGFLSTKEAGGFTGTTIGLYATSK